ncbi:MAG TPA: FHA domain-containing protein, partial [Longimicrobiaceae bacterium]|nr:FHA domain-containing protein [Longimicrobiaceae bacterium]
VSTETEGRLTVAVDTAIGQRLLSTFAGGDHVYAADPQFLLSRDLVEGGWRIAPAPGARNPTFLNGVELTGESAPLENAATISIGPSRLRLRVEIED